MGATTEQTRTIEITQSQYKHLKEVMAMSKPSRTRLTIQEKSMIRYLCNHYLEETDQSDTIDVVRSILKKLN